MSVTLRQPLTLAEVQLIREWRNDPAVLPMLRTGYKTEEEQAAFYRDVICNPGSAHRYYAIDDSDGGFIGMGGLTDVWHWEGDHRWRSDQAEISLILGPRARGKGYGALSVDALLAEARRLGLGYVVGECYATGNLGFWTKQIVRRPALMKWRWTISPTLRHEVNT